MDANTAYQKCFKAKDMTCTSKQEKYNSRWVIRTSSGRQLFAGDIYDCCMWLGALKRFNERKI